MNFCILNDWFCPVEHLGLPADLRGFCSMAVSLTFYGGCFGEDFISNFIHLAAIINPVFFVICGKYLTYLTT